MAPSWANLTSSPQGCSTSPVQLEVGAERVKGLPEVTLQPRPPTVHFLSLQATAQPLGHLGKAWLPGPSLTLLWAPFHSLALSSALLWAHPCIPLCTAHLLSASSPADTPLHRQHFLCDVLSVLWEAHREEAQSCVPRVPLQVSPVLIKGGTVSSAYL